MSMSTSPCPVEPMCSGAQEYIAKMLGVPTLRPFQHEIHTELSHYSAYHPTSPNTTLACLPTGSGKSYIALSLLVKVVYLL